MAEIDGLPDVDLSPIIDDLEKQQDKEPAKTKQEDKTQTREKVEQDLAQFKTPQDLLKAYKEIQGAFTKKSQDNKELEKRISELQEQIELSRNSTPFVPQNQQNDDNFYENPQQSIQQAILMSRISEILEEEQENNPDEFQERYAFAQRVIGQYPQLANTPGGIRKAFKYGDKLRRDYLKTSTSKAMEAIFGEPLNDEEINRLRTFVKGDKQLKQTTTNSNAYMPDTDTSNARTLNQNQKPNVNEKITDSAKKGDVDGVLDGIFQRQLAE